MNVRSVRHVGIVVSDAERALGFYRDLLGLRVEVDQVEEGAFVETILGLPAVRVRTVKLASPEGATLVELLQFNVAGDRASGARGLAEIGPTHAALTVEDIDELYVRLAYAGVRFISSPQTSVDGRARVAFCADPDGTMLELVEPIGG